MNQFFTEAGSRSPILSVSLCSVMKRSHLLFLCVSLCLGCTSTVSRLANLDCLINEHPDSAFRIIQEIPPETLSSSRAKAYYSLQRTKAMDKCFLTIDQDSLIKDAVRFFPHRFNTHRIAETWYYQGRIQYTNQQFNQAVVSFSKASVFADKAPHDPLLKGLIALNQAHTFGSIYNDLEQYTYARKSLGFFIETGERSRTDAASLMMVEALHAMRKWEQAERMYDSLERVSPDDTLMMQRILLSHAAACLYRPEKDIARSYALLSRAMEEYHAPMDQSDYARYAYVLHALGWEDTSNELLSQLEQIGPADPVELDIRYQLAKDNRQDSRALLYLEKLTAIQDSVVTASLRQEVLSAQRDFFILSMEQAQNNIRNQRLVLLVFILLSLITGLIGWLLFKSWQQKVQHERVFLQEAKDEAFRLLSESRQELQDIEATMNSTLQAQDLLRRQYINLYKHQFVEISKLCEPLIRFKYAGYSRKIIPQVRAVLASFVNRSDKNPCLEDLLDKHLGNVMKSFRNEYPNYKETDYQIICFLIAGFDAKFIALVTDIRPDYVYVRKSRYIKTILSHPTDNQARYLELLGYKA